MPGIDEPQVYCRGCGTPMLPGPARAVGVCVDCIEKSTRSVATIPRAQYASSADSESSGYSTSEQEERP